jgi:phenylacetate-CoA ligase
LEILPLIDKNGMRQLVDAWKPQRGEASRIYRTSGSTGAPLEFPVGEERISHDIAAKWRATRWWGVDIGDPEIVVWGSPIETRSQTMLKRARDRILRTRLLPIRVVDAALTRNYVEEIRRREPRMIFGYPSMLAHLGRAALELGLAPERPPRVIFSTSEILRPEWRAAMQDGFKTVVADEYGARDAGFIARACPSGRLHINAEDIIVEIVGEDGKRVPHGMVGEVAVTNMATGIFPFIRYRTGDFARIDPTQCPCGRAHPVIGEIVGRTNDCLVRRDGALVHDSAFNYVLRSIATLAAYQIRQSRADLVTVLIVSRVPLSAGERAHVIAEYGKLLGRGVTVEMREVDGIEPGPGGKHRHVICDVGSEAKEVAGPGSYSHGLAPIQ